MSSISPIGTGLDPENVKLDECKEGLVALSAALEADLVLLEEDSGHCVLTAALETDKFHPLINRLHKHMQDSILENSGGRKRLAGFTLQQLAEAMNETAKDLDAPKQSTALMDRLTEIHAVAMAEPPLPQVQAARRMNGLPKNASIEQCEDALGVLWKAHCGLEKSEVPFSDYTKIEVRAHEGEGVDMCVYYGDPFKTKLGMSTANFIGKLQGHISSTDSHVAIDDHLHLSKNTHLYINNRATLIHAINEAAARFEPRVLQEISEIGNGRAI